MWCQLSVDKLYKMSRVGAVCSVFLEAETRQRLLRTVKKEVGVFSSAVIESEKQTRFCLYEAVQFKLHIGRILR